jgi:hypothetical protein
MIGLLRDTDVALPLRKKLLQRALYQIRSSDLEDSGHRHARAKSSPVSHRSRKSNSNVSRGLKRGHNGRLLALPLVIVLEQHRADQPDNFGFVREDADDIGAARRLTSLLSRSSGLVTGMKIAVLTRSGGIGLVPAYGATIRARAAGSTLSGQASIG